MATIIGNRGRGTGLILPTDRPCVARLARVNAIHDKTRPDGDESYDCRDTIGRRRNVSAAAVKRSRARVEPPTLLPPRPPTKTRRRRPVGRRFVVDKRLANLPTAIRVPRPARDQVAVVRAYCADRNVPIIYKPWRDRTCRRQKQHYTTNCDTFRYDNNNVVTNFYYNR